GRTVTLATDWAPFTEADLNEAGNRLRRLGQVYALLFVMARREQSRQLFSPAELAILAVSVIANGSRTWSLRP
ncbi:MAG TPA: hypothetical protein VF468_24600, partial [Actinomycetota bacterium]|nr:hypothetical protein [Actinomycetota bacterium]